jgi:hypothetical protein
VIERYKSGFLHPEDVPFEDLSTRSGSIGSDSGSTNGGSIVGSGLNGGGSDSGRTHSSIISSSGGGVKESSVKGGTIAALKAKKRLGILGIFNSGKVSALNLNEFQFKQKQFHKFNEFK